MGEIPSLSDSLKVAETRHLQAESRPVPKLRNLTLEGLSPSPVCFSSYEEFLALSEDEMLRLVNAVALAGIGDLKRLFSLRFPGMRDAEKDGAAMLAIKVLAVGAGVARINANGRMEFDIETEQLETFANILVEKKVRDAFTIINSVTSNIMAELTRMTADKP